MGGKGESGLTLTTKTSAKRKGMHRWRGTCISCDAGSLAAPDNTRAIREACASASGKYGTKRGSPMNDKVGSCV